MQRSRYTHIAKQVFPYSQESTTGSLQYSYHNRSPYTPQVNNLYLSLERNNYIYQDSRRIPIQMVMLWDLQWAEHFPGLVHSQMKQDRHRPPLSQGGKRALTLIEGQVCRSGV